ncbi:hypothetical protein GW915_01845 [bacterium]|nr:hypothetical protein [bacterium]
MESTSLINFRNFIAVTSVFLSAASFSQTRQTTELLEGVARRLDGIHSRSLLKAVKKTEKAGEAAARALKTNDEVVSALNSMVRNSPRQIVADLPAAFLSSDKFADFIDPQMFRLISNRISSKLKVAPDHPAAVQVLGDYLTALSRTSKADADRALASSLPKIQRELAVAVTDAEKTGLLTQIKNLGDVKVKDSSVSAQKVFDSLSPEQQSQVIGWSAHWDRIGSGNMRLPPESGDSQVDFLLSSLFRNRLQRGTPLEAVADASSANSVRALSDVAPVASRAFNSADALGAKHGPAMVESIENMMKTGRLSAEEADDFIKAVGKENSSLRGLASNNPLLENPASREKLIEAYTSMRKIDAAHPGSLGSNPSALLKRLSNFDDEALEGVTSLLSRTADPKKARDVLNSLHKGVEDEIAVLTSQIEKFKAQGGQPLESAQKRLDDLKVQRKDLANAIEQAGDDVAAVDLAMSHTLRRAGFSAEEASDMIRCLRQAA